MALKFMVIFVPLMAVFIERGDCEDVKAVDGIGAVFHAGKEEFVLGEPVWVDFVLTNNTSEKISFTIGNGREDSFQFFVAEQPEGASVDISHYYEFGGLSQARVIQSKQSYSQRLLLNEYVWLKKPGRFKIKCAATFLVVVGHKPSVKLPPATLELTINDDKNALAAIIEELAKQSSRPNPRLRMDAVRALAAVRDSSVFNILESLVSDQDDMVSETAIRGIYNVGTPDAKRLLEGLSRRIAKPSLNKLVTELSAGISSDTSNPSVPAQQGEHGTK